MPRNIQTPNEANSTSRKGKTRVAAARQIALKGATKCKDVSERKRVPNNTAQNSNIFGNESRIAELGSESAPHVRSDSEEGAEACANAKRLKGGDNEMVTKAGGTDLT